MKISPTTVTVTPIVGMASGVSVSPFGVATGVALVMAAGGTSKCYLAFDYRGLVVVGWAVRYAVGGLLD